MEWTRLPAMFCVLIGLCGCAPGTPEVTFDAPVIPATEESPTDPSPNIQHGPTTAPPPARQPNSVRLTMSFAPQAPHGNWDPPYDEACEESSLIIVRHFLEQTPLDASTMNTEILTMIAHEESKGLPIDIDMLQLAQVARDMFGYQATVVKGAEVTIERIERELARGVPVILPLAGQDIGNPYYSGDGPPYHVLVVVGYDDGHFVTHDVGTKRGAYYAYDKDVLMAAIHDWNGSVDTIRSGPRRMLIVTK